MTSHSNLLPALASALFVTSAVSAFAAFKIYRNSRTQQSDKALTVVICTVMAVLFAFGAVWAMFPQPR